MKNRILTHTTVRAGDLVPHELNHRVHNDTQRTALAALQQEIGFARSLLVYQLPEGRYKIIGGHLRVSIDPDGQVAVKVLDINDAETRAPLLSIDAPAP